MNPSLGDLTEDLNLVWQMKKIARAFHLPAHLDLAC